MAPSKELVAASQNASFVLHHLSWALDVQITKILANGMGVTANDSISAFGSKLYLSNQRDVRQLAYNVLQILVPFLITESHSNSQTAAKYSSTSASTSASASSMRLTFPSSVSFLSTANFGMTSPLGATEPLTAAANDTDLLCCDSMRSFSHPAAGDVHEPTTNPVLLLRHDPRVWDRVDKGEFNIHPFLDDGLVFLLLNSIPTNKRVGSFFLKVTANLSMLGQE